MSTGSRQTFDPASHIDEPLRAALGWLVMESTAALALVALAVVCPTILRLDGPACDVVHFAGPVALTAWVLGSWVVRTMRPRPPVSHAQAWERARLVDPTEAAAAVAIATVSTLAVGLAFAVIVRFYFMQPGMGATTIMVLLPALIALYLSVIATGVHNLTDRLARGMGESDARFRAYWRGVAERREDGPQA